MKRLLLLISILFVVIVGFITIQFGSALSQEKNTAAVLSSIVKLEFSKNDYVRISTTDKGSTYVTANKGTPRFAPIHDFMKDKGWSYKEQEGSGLFFSKGEETVIIETRQYSKNYFLWEVPSKVVS